MSGTDWGVSTAIPCSMRCWAAVNRRAASWMSWWKAPRRASNAICRIPRSSKPPSKGQAVQCVSVDFAPRFRRFGRMFRPPMLMRRIEPVAGRPRITLRLRPTFDYGARRRRSPSGSNHIRYFGDASVLRLTTDASLNYVLHETEFSLDRPLTLIVGADESITDNVDVLSRSFLGETEIYWQTWVRDLNIPFDWQAAVIRAAITLKLCSYEDTGAVLAALTTSMPEAPGTPRTWDYRFYLAARCLLHRDGAQSPVGDAHHGKLRALHHRCRGSRQLARRGRHDPAAVPHRAGHGHGRAADQLASRLPRPGAGAHRQCCGRPAPERHLWFDDPDGSADVLGRAPAAQGDLELYHRSASSATRRIAPR